MTEANRNTIEQKYAMLLAAICLLVGIVGGWFLHIPQAPAVPADKTAVASTQATSQIGERRVGKECLRLCRSRWSPYH